MSSINREYASAKYYNPSQYKLNALNTGVSFKASEEFGYLIAQGATSLLDFLKLRSNISNYEDMENVVNIAAGIIYERNNSREKGIVYNKFENLRQACKEFNDPESTLWICALLNYIETDFDSKQNYYNKLIESINAHNFVFPSTNKGKLEFSSCLLYISTLKMKNLLKQPGINNNPTLQKSFYVARKNANNFLFTSTIFAKLLSHLSLDKNQSDQVLAKMTESLSGDPVNQFPEGLKRVIENSSIPNSIKLKLSELGIKILDATGKQSSSLNTYFVNYKNNNMATHVPPTKEPPIEDSIQSIDYEKRFSTISGHVRNLQEALQVLDMKQDELTPQNLKIKYRKLSRQFHPQYHQNEDAKFTRYMTMINLAKDYLENYHLKQK